MFGQSRSGVLKEVAEWAEDPQMPESVRQALSVALGHSQCRDVLTRLRVPGVEKWSDPEALFATSLLDLVDQAQQEKGKDRQFDLRAKIQQPVRTFNQFGVTFYSPQEDPVRVRFDQVQRMVAGSGIGAAISAIDAAVSGEPDLQKLTPKQALGVLQVLQSGILGREVITS